MTMQNKQLSFVKKTALRDIQNENRMLNTIGNSPLPKDKGQLTVDTIKVSGIKRPSVENPKSFSRSETPATSAANSHIVYVRRKSEAEPCKIAAFDGKSINSDSPSSRQLGHQEDTVQAKPQTGEPMVSHFPAFVAMPVTSLISASGKYSLPPAFGHPNVRFVSMESNYYSTAAASPMEVNPKGAENLHWEERYHHLQILLKQLDESDQQDYVQMLRSLSSVDLSRHAVELEKRAILLSLEEAKEVQRVGVLSVLVNSLKNLKAPPG